MLPAPISLSDDPTTGSNLTPPPSDSAITLDTLAAAVAASTTNVRTGKGVPLPLLEHPKQIKEQLDKAHNYFTQAAQESHMTSYAAEWFLDNYYIIQQALQQIAEAMPEGYYEQLPKLASGPWHKYPRIYILAQELGHHFHNHITARDQAQFINLYQSHVMLTTGELWAWPTMLRMVEIEALVGAIAGLMEEHSVALETLLTPQLHSVYRADATPDTVVANSVISLRAINAENWRDFFENVSQVEAILRRDLTYPHMDFETRNRYRHQVEQLAKHAGITEEQTARHLLQLAQRQAQGSDERKQHVGYYLVDEGLAEAQSALGYRAPSRERLQTWAKRHSLALYIGSIAFFTMLVLDLLVSTAILTGGGVLMAVLVVMVGIIPAMSAATQLVNWLATKLVAPVPLPKLDFSEGIPPAYRTMVVIPSLITSEEAVESLLSQLEQHYLRNTDNELSFAILADYKDADHETMPQDQPLLERALAGIETLNSRYGEAQPFYFFLRRRQWNAAEGKWMGYERKRGKLAEFNKLLLDPHLDTSYIVKSGDLSVLPKIRYVITLDTDTVLARDGAQRLVGTFAHPLNQARFNEASGQITSGYTILQPRVEILPNVANQTPFTRLFAGESGLDLYSLAVSDVYQDLFGEGVFVGKGIYDVAAFERSLLGRVPENALLSHDLFEGLHGRTALVSDIVLFEGYPSHYLAHTTRLHRWIRGDWQLLPMLFPRVPVADGSHQPSVFSALDLWKMADNLRRSLLHPTLLLMILLSWIMLPGSALVWTAAALGVLLIPFLLEATHTLTNSQLNNLFNEAQRHHLRLSLQRWALSVAFLPHEALVRLDAIRVTLYRLWRRKGLLEWATSDSVERKFSKGASSNSLVWNHMLSGLVLVVGTAIAAALLNPASLIASLPLVAAWCAGPAIAAYISRPTPHAVESITEDQERQLRRLARRTWLFFEEFVGPEDHWLPPDHYQQAPITKVGHYTSPTNIGLMLVSTLAAYDLGYIGLLDFTTRVKLCFDSLGQLERYRGHLLNWYNTQTFQPLLPRYVSTVDNGNFASSLLVLQQGCHTLSAMPLLRQQRWQGVLDILDVLDELVAQIEERHQANELTDAAQDHLTTMRQAILTNQQQVSHWATQLDQITTQYWPSFSNALVKLLENAESSHVGLMRDLRIYLSRLQQHLSNMRRDLDMLLPWHSAFQTVPPAITQHHGAAISAWQALVEAAQQPVTLDNLPEIYAQVEANLTALQQSIGTEARAVEWCNALLASIQKAKQTAVSLQISLATIKQSIETEFTAMDFGFLFNRERCLFHIGYNVDSEQLDNSYYDLLASEARLTSFLAIAKRDVPLKHWLQLGRSITQVGDTQTLFSWSGTMFEYLMPLLFTGSHKETLLHQSYQAVVEGQIHYAEQHKMPWGISESGYYAFDNSQNYQYRAFGLPSVALKRGQDRDMVIAPYASMLALPLAPQRVLENLQPLTEQEALTAYGLIEALDYTPAHLPLGRDVARVQEYMAHHQGMIFISLTNFLANNVMVKRFLSHPQVQSVEVLLMERIPTNPILETKNDEEVKYTNPLPTIANHHWEVPSDAQFPQAHYLSNGRYAVMLTSSGSGYSQWGKRALTRWRADTTLDDWGQWLYIHEAASKAVWSPSFQPLGGGAQTKAHFYIHQAEFHARAYDISSRLAVLVPPDDDLEIRRLLLINHTEDERQVTICSYAEMVMALQLGDQRHQAYNKMFIESEPLPDLNGLLFRRRPRSPHDEPLYVLHMVVMADGTSNPAQFETDRARFLGRNRTPRNPLALESPQVTLSGTSGATLDPIMALAQTLTIPEHSSVELAYITIAGASREEVIATATRYRAWEQLDRAFDQARYHSERELHNLGLTSDEVGRIQKLLSALLYPTSILRAAPQILAANRKGQNGLWTYGISGDYPIVMAQISREEHLELVYELLQAHRFWRDRGFDCTLVILNQRDTGYMQELYNQLHRLIVNAGSEIWMNRHNGIFILRSEQLAEEDRTLLRSAARVLLNGDDGMLHQQLDIRSWNPSLLPPLTPIASIATIQDTASPLQRPTDLQFDNGVGGFSPDSSEYVIYVDKQTTTPAAWVNVMANPNGGFILSEAGGGYSWAQNSGEHKLTPWRNDPVMDMPSEAIYLRDEETAHVWSPTPMPAPTQQPYLIKHGMGYSTIEHHSDGLRQTVAYTMAPDDAVKLVRIRLKNTATHPRRITVTYYLEWVLDAIRDLSQQYLIPEYDAENRTVLIHNPYNVEFSNAYAFVTTPQAIHSMTTDRSEFLGRMGSYAQPAALRRLGLAGTVQAGLDLCTALQVHVDLPVGGEQEICFVIGSGQGRDAAMGLSQRYATPAAIQTAWEANRTQWQSLVTSIVARTPDPAMNILLPRLLYQTLACRIWGRSALYQAGGAYGFRDQLQDVMALIHVRPEITREHLLRAARYQFEAGDVLHWWHPPSGRGVRTRCSDDLIWLPFVVSQYIASTGDKAILEEQIPFLKGDPLRDDEEERYGHYQATTATYSLYEHCRRALDKAYSLGQHGLPLMKAGDWNDGMNLVGIEGRGESVWLGWFLHIAMKDFAEFCRERNDWTQLDIYRERMEALEKALESAAWDGQWYRRAFHDDGSILGSQTSDECQIDSLPQSWAVLSGVADPARTETAMQAVLDRLVSTDDDLIKLFTPAFNLTPHNPGYIQGYPPGIRENGGQYTHAALWVVWAFTELGKGDIAQALFARLNPIHHGDTPEKMARYRVEPYVIAADVAGEPPHEGRGGWTWYSGSSGWMYRLAVEQLLGLRREGAILRFMPCTAAEWYSYEIDYRYAQTVYTITFQNPDRHTCGVREVILDGKPQGSNFILLVDDGNSHQVTVTRGQTPEEWAI